MFKIIKSAVLKKNIIKNVFIIIIIIIIIFYYFLKQQYRFSNNLIFFVNENCTQLQKCYLDIKDIADFEWDKMYYFKEGYILDNEKYKNLNYIKHGLADHQIIFIKDNKVVYSERLRSGIEGRIKNEIIFNDLDYLGVGEYFPNNSLFEIIKTTTGNGGYFGKKDYFISLNQNELQKVSLIKDIDSEVNSINQYKNYKIKTLENEEFLEQMTDGGGHLSGYFKEGQIKKIIEKFGLSYCVKTFEYYFLNGKLIFIFEKEDDFPYDENIAGLNYEKLELVFEGHYYFDNKNLIKIETKGKKKFENNTSEKSLLNMTYDNLNLLYK